ncbi:hypothetical protein Q8G71_36355, partial [Klebsiella pneumoniae]
MFFSALLSYSPQLNERGIHPPFSESEVGTLDTPSFFICLFSFVPRKLNFLLVFLVPPKIALPRSI